MTEITTAFSRSGPLSGVRVLSFTHMLMGPAAAQYLADLGADVVKVEPPTGARERHWAGADAFDAGTSLFFLAANRNQRSLRIDLKSRSAQTLFGRLLAWADVLIETYRPGVMERLGLGYDEVVKNHSHLVYVSGTGYGNVGPYADRPGQDLLAQGLSGLTSVTGSRDALPTPTGAAVADQHAASLIAMGALAGLVYRTRQGSGCRMSVNLLQAALDLQLEGLTYHLNGHRIERPSRGGTTAFHPAPYGIYTTRDGHLAVSLTPLSRLALAIGTSVTIPDEEAYERRDEIRRLLEPIFLSETTTAWIERLEARGVWCGPVKDYDEMQQDPQIRALEPFIEVVSASGSSYRTLRSPVTVAGYVPPPRYPPELGEHTASILGEMGLDPATIERLREEGTI